MICESIPKAIYLAHRATSGIQISGTLITLRGGTYGRNLGNVDINHAYIVEERAEWALSIRCGWWFGQGLGWLGWYNKSCPVTHCNILCRTDYSNAKAFDLSSRSLRWVAPPATGTNHRLLPVYADTAELDVAHQMCTSDVEIRSVTHRVTPAGDFN
jgi:hypothetical protein